MTSPFQHHLVDLIREEGPLRFDRYMEVALYHPRWGYYADAERSGWSGHFLTSPQLDPAFGELWARAFTSAWEASGAGGPLVLVEVGPGEGGFIAAVLDALDDAGIATESHLVERIPALRKRQQDVLGDRTDVQWWESVDDLPRFPSACAIANEVLDNIPVRVVEMNGGRLEEVFVGLGRPGIQEVLGSPADETPAEHLRSLKVALSDGHRFEIRTRAEALVRSLARSVERGLLAFVDYGDTSQGLAARPQGTLLCYSAGGTDDAVLDRPGEKDITVHADWDSVRAVLEREGFVAGGPLPQRQIMRRLGAAELDASLRRAHDEAVAAGRGAAALRNLSRRHALAALLDPGGLGGLGVVVGTKGIPLPGFLDDAT